MRSGHDLLGTSLDMAKAVWLGTSGGIGAGIDSFYEYMLKAYIMFGEQASDQRRKPLPTMHAGFRLGVSFSCLPPCR